MQKAVNDIIDIFTGEDMENTLYTGYFPVKHLHLYNQLIIFNNNNTPLVYYVHSNFKHNVY